jgi:hypothetical protein
MTKCIGCKKEFNHQGFPSHKKSRKAYKREIRARLSNVADYAPGPTTDNEGVVTEDAGDPETLVEVSMDEVQVSKYEMNEI